MLFKELVAGAEGDYIINDYSAPGTLFGQREIIEVRGQAKADAQMILKGHFDKRVLTVRPVILDRDGRPRAYLEVDLV